MEPFEKIVNGFQSLNIFAKSFIQMFGKALNLFLRASPVIVPYLFGNQHTLTLSLVVSDMRSETKESQFESGYLLAMCRGEFSAVIARLMSNCL